MFHSAEFARKINAFGKARSGTFAILMALVLTVLALSAGFAVNLAQLYNVRSSLSQALDAAVTSTARDITTGKIVPDDARAWVELFLKANGDPTFMASDKLVLNQLTVDKVNSTIDATAYVDVDLFFPLFGLPNERRVTGASASVYSDKRIEVAMMLDVTGSMDGQKIKDLRTAASNAVDTFLAGQDASKPRVRVALVPYANAVNTGTLQNVVFAEDKYTAGDVEPPKLDDPIAVSGYTAPDACATERKGSQQFSDASPYTAKVNRDNRLDFCPTATLVPLSADGTALKTAIGKFKAGGYTAGHIGVQWSWYMLSPKWRDVLPKAAQPLDYDPKKVAKYAILMTDGEFNTAFAGVSKKGTTTNQPTLSRGNADQLCAKMRAEGIEIFTVGFMLNEDNAKKIMQKCASADTSSIKHYYETSSGTELNQAFQAIARNIERLAITK
ncbi:MAG: pilus assembly protein [Hyphomicrobiales bacterium]|nr:pilus assembly protein [Hyphomicrobiales bacterium]